MTIDAALNGVTPGYFACISTAQAARDPGGGAGGGGWSGAAPRPPAGAPTRSKMPSRALPGLDGVEERAEFGRRLVGRLLVSRAAKQRRR